jgi:membrane protease YdiL (CAAX protease family)
MQKIKDAITFTTYGSFLAFLAVGLAILIQYLFGYLAIEFNNESNLASVLKPFSICLATAFFEEYIFRVLLMRLLLKVVRKHYVVIILGSFFFAIAHAANSHFSLTAFVSHFLGGIVYSYTYLKTKEIWLPFGLHFGWNFTQAILGMPVSGSSLNGLLNITFSSETLYHGGLYGFEGGVISLASRILLFFSLVYLLRGKYTPILKYIHGSRFH